MFLCSVVHRFWQSLPTGTNPRHWINRCCILSELAYSESLVAAAHVRKLARFQADTASLVPETREVHKKSTVFSPSVIWEVSHRTLEINKKNTFESWYFHFQTKENVVSWSLWVVVLPWTSCDTIGYCKVPQMTFLTKSRSWVARWTSRLGVTFSCLGMKQALGVDMVCVIGSDRSRMILEASLSPKACRWGSPGRSRAYTLNVDEI